MSKRNVKALTFRNTIYGKTLPENEVKNIEPKKVKSILIKRNR